MERTPVDYKVPRNTAHGARSNNVEWFEIRHPGSRRNSAALLTAHGTACAQSGPRNELHEEAERELQRAALQDGILKTAANARSTISGTLLGFGFHEVDSYSLSAHVPSTTASFSGSNSIQQLSLDS